MASRRRCLDRGSMVVESTWSWIAWTALVLVFVQVVMWGLATGAARSAADAALAQARVETGTAGDGTGTAAAVIDVRAGNTLQDPAISVDRGDQTVTVTVTGHAYLVPFPVSVTAAGPVERFIPDSEVD